MTEKDLTPRAPMQDTSAPACANSAEQAAPAQLPMQQIAGTSACAGLALGPVRVITRRSSALGRIVLEPPRETSLFKTALVLAKDEIAKLSEMASESDKAIFTFQIEVLNDHGLQDEVLGYIQSGSGAADAMERAESLYTAKIRSLPDEYLSQRAGDVQDACRRVVDILDGRPREQITLDGPCVLIADELLPSELISIDRKLLLGLVTSGGSTQSHASIIARTFGIPAVVMAGPEVLKVPEGTICALDGGTGEVVIHPDEATYARYTHRIHLARRRTLSQERLRTQPCVTRDGVRVALTANCSGPQDIAQAISLGAEGVGLLRSEFLFLDGNLPDEAEQLNFYRSCVLAAGGKPVTIRTLDIGADKDVAGLTLSETNPALGLRGLRFSLARPDLFLAQLCALLKAGLAGPLRIMFPMVASVEDFDRAMEMVAQARDTLTQRGEAFSDSIEFGVMVETPAAALLSDELAKRADFFSIGTNDLTQYVHAVDRINPAVTSYFTPASPAVLRLIRLIVGNAEQAGIPVSICGESAADPDLALLYVQAGIRRLSMSAPSILAVKERLMDATAATG